jgi:epoxyqueuosine reductase
VGRHDDAVPIAVRSDRRVPAAADLVALGRAHGLDAVGVATAERFATAERQLERRKAGGLHGGMAFTYRAPARSCDPAAALPGARALVVGARSYRREPVPVSVAPPGDSGPVRPLADPPAAGPVTDRPAAGSVRDGPAAARVAPATGRVARYAWDDHYGPLRAALTAVADALRADGWRARVVADDNALVDREAAYRAGLGWYGKNANLLLPGQGSWFVLGSVITDAPVPPTGGPVDDGCGTCTRCLDGCPTGAIVAPGVVDARRCLAWLVQAEGMFPREYRVALGDRIYGCDDCQEVCPPNRRLDRRGRAPAAGDSAQPHVDLLDLLAAPDDELLARHGRWYIPRRQPRYLRRNALVALGNVADAGDIRVAGALARALGSPDPVVRGHAVWAARRLGRDDLIAAAGVDARREHDPAVRAELLAPVEARRPGA